MPIPIWVLIVILVATTALQLLLTPRPKGPNAEAVDAPVVSEKVAVNVVVGTDLMTATKTTWWGDALSKPKKKRAGCSNPTVGWYYFMGEMLSLCWGWGFQVKVLGLRQESKWIWRGELNDGDELFVDKSQLFGNSGGGVVHKLKFYAGNGTDGNTTADSYLTSQNGGWSPAYRHLAYLIFYGPATHALPYLWNGYIGESPYPRPKEILVQALPEYGSDWDLGPEWDGLTWIDDPDAPGEKDINPAAWIYLIHTNKLWAMGIPPDDFYDPIKVSSLLAAAQVLKDEGHGLSNIQTESIDGDEWIKEICRHIDALYFRDPIDGEWTLKLVRDDYDPETLPILSASNCELLETVADGLGNLISSVNVTFKDRAADYVERPATYHDLATTALQGRQTFRDASYPYCRRASLATRYAQRDQLILGNPLKRVTIEANRYAARWRPGDVFRLQWKYGNLQSDVIYRVIDIDPGTLVEGVVTIKAIQDRFAIGETLFSLPSNGWQPVDYDAVAPMAYRLEESPFFLFGDALPRLAVFCGRPNPLHTGYRLDAREGSGEFEEFDENRRFVPASYLVNAVSGYEAPDQDGVWVVAGNSTLAALVNQSEAQLRGGQNLALVVSAGSSELIVFETITADGPNFVLNGVRHGLLDTTPRAHPAASVVWFLSYGDYSTPGWWTAGETVETRFRTFTPSDLLPEIGAPTDSLTFNRRAERPLPPSGVKIQDEYRGHFAGETYVRIEWSERNRLSQADFRWQDDPTTEAEAGTTYTVRVYGEFDELLHTESGVTGTEYVYHDADQMTHHGYLADWLTFEVESVRDGLTSHQFQKLKVYR